MRTTMIFNGVEHVQIEKIMDLTGYGEVHLRELAKKSVIPAIKFGKRWWFDPAKIMPALMARSEQPAKRDILDGI